MIFQVGHFARVAAFQPFGKARGFIFEKFSFRDPAKRKTQLSGYCLYYTRTCAVIHSRISRLNTELFAACPDFINRIAFAAQSLMPPLTLFQREIKLQRLPYPTIVTRKEFDVLGVLAVFCRIRSSARSKKLFCFRIVCNPLEPCSGKNLHCPSRTCSHLLHVVFYHPHGDLPVIGDLAEFTSIQPRPFLYLAGDIKRHSITSHFNTIRLFSINAIFLFGIELLKK